MDVATKIIADGSALTESPRWHEGKLWYVDVPTHRLLTVDLQGNQELVAEFEDRLQAVDFLPDGTALVALGFSRQILRLADRSVYADLSHLEHEGRPFLKLNDMVIDGQGRLFVDITMPREDHFSTDDHGDAIAVVDPSSAQVRIAATGTFSPNGIAVTPDGARLISAEYAARRLASYAISGDGTLSDRRVLTEEIESTPDGICVDSEGAVWTSTMEAGRAVRIGPTGEVLDQVQVQDGHYVVATMLGGPELRHLFIATCAPPGGALDSWDDACNSEGFIQVVEVDVPGAGWPAATQSPAAPGHMAESSGPR